MDRTLLTVSSGTRWVRFLRRWDEISRWQLARALGWAVQYHLSLLDMASVAQRVAADLTGPPEADMPPKGELWIADEMPHHRAVRAGPRRGAPRARRARRPPPRCPT